MAITVAKTSHTTFVRETQDFATALATVGGYFYAYPRSLGSSTLLGLPFADCINAVNDYEEGDMALTNDPFLSKAGCTHVPDITVWSPVFVGKELLCFTWGFIHSSDMGGSVPGSIAPDSTDTFQEGFRIPPLKLYRRGEVNDDVRAIMVNNVRIPQQMWGDVQALRAGHHVATKKLKALAERHGVEKMRTVMEDLLTYSELKARKVFRTFKPGTYSFSDYLEDDTITNVPVRINLSMTVKRKWRHPSRLYGHGSTGRLLLQCANVRQGPSLGDCGTHVLYRESGSRHSDKCRILPRYYGQSSAWLARQRDIPGSDRFAISYRRENS